MGLPSLREITPDEPRSEGKTRLADAPLAVQLAPFGDFKGVLNKADGKTRPIVQHLDRAAFRTMNPSFNRNIFLGHASKHFSGKEKHLKNNIPLRQADYDLMPTAWWNPDKIIPLKKHHYSLELNTLDGGYIQLAVNTMRGFSSFYKTKIPLGVAPGNAPFIPYRP